jgi:hypothetical protein
MRSDLESMTRGRTAAQAAHAGTQLGNFFDKQWEMNTWAKQALYNFQNEGHNFGTTIIFDGGDLQSIMEIFVIPALSSVLRGSVVDPTYPVQDGTWVHEVSIRTCVWFFCDPATLDANHPVRKLIEQSELLQ